MKKTNKWIWAALAGVGVTLGLVAAMVYMQGQGSRTTSPRVSAQTSSSTSRRGSYQVETRDISYQSKAIVSMAWLVFLKELVACRQWSLRMALVATMTRS